MTQATETDFSAYARLSESEQEVLEQALASIPDDVLSTSDRPAIESRIRNRLQREGILTTGGPFQLGEIPAVALVGRAMVCLASSYVTLRGISNNQPAEAVAGALARTLSGCVSGSVDAIKADILLYRSQVGRACEALGLPALRDALLAGDSAGCPDLGRD